MADRAQAEAWSVERHGAGSLLLKFVGPTSTAAFADFLAALTERMPDVPATLIFDLRELEGYNPETKEPMKAWLNEHKPALQELIVVVPKSRPMLKVVTAAIGLAVGVKISISEELPGGSFATSAASA